MMAAGPRIAPQRVHAPGMAAPRLRAVAACAGLIAALGCNPSHVPTRPAIDDATPVRDLTENDWWTFCEWLESLRGDEARRYECDATGPLPMTCTPAEMPPCYDWRAGTCMVSEVLGVRPFWTPGPPGCEPTVSELADCWASRAALVCYRGRATPECSLAYCLPSDGGSPDGG